MRLKKGKKITYGCLLLFLVISPSGWAKNDGVVENRFRNGPSRRL